MDAPKLLWDIGTGYDFFVSLIVLHDPSDFGVRAAWAAGMRQRLPAAERDLLEKLDGPLLCRPPLIWLNTLPGPKDSAEILDALYDLPPLKRVEVLSELPPRALTVLRRVAACGEWDENNREALQSVLKKHELKPHSPKYLTEVLNLWANAEEYGERLPDALQVYYEVFFAEEERRIRPAIEDGLAHAQELAQHLEVSDLVTELSQGVRISEFWGVSELVLAPAFWATPFIFHTLPSQTRMVMLFGSRPASASLVPGEVVPDALINALKALSDPTRLRILRYLASEALTPTQLAHRLRLRTPTVIHHLRALRAAGLIYVLVGPDEAKKEGGYQTRTEGLHGTWKALKEFILEEDEDG